MKFSSPAEVAKNYISTGKAKVNLSIGKMLVLGVMAGAFIAFAGIASTTAAVSVPLASVARLVSAVVFPGGLAMVLIAGSELFTGNCLLIIPLLEREIRILDMLKNWLFVYIGNLIGGLLVAAGVVFSHQLSLFDNALAVSVISTAIAKCAMPFTDALIKGILCNFLVCIATWMSFAAKNVTGKVFAVFFPIMLFVLCGFEHSVANMYYIGAGLFAKLVPAYAEAAAGLDLAGLTWGRFFIANLLPVTLGNIIGGGLCVGGVYWFCYLNKGKRRATLRY